MYFILISGLISGFRRAFLKAITFIGYKTQRLTLNYKGLFY